MAVKSAIKSALADGKVTDEEREMIEKAAEGLSKDQEEPNWKST